MDNSEVQLVGGPCGQHGPYTFYKAFKYSKNGIKRIVTLSEFFFVKLWIDSDLLCIGELQLLWSDKNSDHQVLASLRLYFLPENTPEGRMDHGEDEVLAISEKVVLRVEDLITWITVDAEWTWGRLAKHEKDVREPTCEEPKIIGSLYTSSLDFSDVEKERKLLDPPDNEGPLVIILSYPRYCRYRAMMRRLEGVENDYLKYKIVNALGGFVVPNKNTRVLFCKDTFDYPELEGHELLCNHLAPKLKGRPRGKRKKRSVSPGSESNESESSVCNVFTTRQKLTRENTKNGLRCDNLRRSTRSTENQENKEFLKELTGFMKTNYTPIGRIPSLGFKELDLYSFYTKVQKLGGYDSVTTNRLWKSIFDDMSGHQNSTSAATVVRRHYERFLLPYERHIKGEEYKPLPVSERRRLKSKTGSSTSDAETSESASRSGNSTPVPVTPTTPTENKEFNIQVKTEAKMSSLRSIRVKPERQKLNDYENKEDRIECNIVKIECAIIPDKNAEPVTTAVAPIAQKLNPEKSLSPVEGKENIPIIKTGDTASTNNKNNIETIEVPYKPKSPEIIDLESNTYKSINQTILHDVKKRKLDILKEGGLEVTPVRHFMAKDARPSVIQQNTTQMTTKLIKNDPHMPPPQLNVPPLKRHLPQKNQNYNYVNGNVPPKVVQSKSIYSYSEKTVYGNPKDYMAPLTPPVAPKFPTFPPRQAGDILDLTVTSPQKPVVEIVKLPTTIPFHMNRNSKPANNLLDGRRLGSNLEITLVGPNKTHKYSPQLPPPPPPPPINRQSHKRSNNDSYMNHKIPRTDNGRYNLSSPFGKLPDIPRSYMGKSSKESPLTTVPKHYSNQAPPPSLIPPPPPPSSFNYMSHLYDSKSVGPYLPLLDPMYYSAAMQSLYGHHNINTPPPPPPPPPVLPFPSSEQLKFYSDLMAHNSRLNFPFPVPPDGNPSNSFKKP